MTKRHPRRTDEEWMNLIQECRTSGMSDKRWCEEHNIHTSNFYYQIRRLRKMACDIPESSHSAFHEKQEIVRLDFETAPASCEYSCAVKPHVRSDGNRQSGTRKPLSASLLA